MKNEVLMWLLKTLSFKSFAFYASLFFISFAQASPNSITFQSRIIKPDGRPLEGSAVNFRFSLTDTVGSCVIYQEDFTNRNMSGSKGLINLAIGTGAKVFPVAAMTLTEAFNNYNSPTLNCQAGGNITAGTTDRRKLIVQFNDSSGWQTVPAMDINSNPYAMQADSALKLGDFPAADYVRTATFPTCVGGEALHFNGASFTCVAVGTGAGTVTSVTSANADIGVATTTTTPILTLNSATTGNDKILKLKPDGTLDAISGVNLTNLNASNLGSGTVAAARMPALTGDVTMTVGTTATTIANDAVTNVKVAAGAAIARSKLGMGTVNQVVVNDGTSGAFSSLGCANGELIKWVAGVPTCSTDLAGVGDIINGGNSTGATVSIGTTDAQSLALKTNNTTKMTILSNGNVGIGTTNPSTSKLQVVSDSISGYFYSDRAMSGASNVWGVFAEAYAGNGGLAPEVIGTYSKASAFSASAAKVYGSQSLATMGGNSFASITDAYGVDAQVSITAGAFTPSISNAYGVRSSVTRAAGTITNAYGVYVDSVQGTNKWSFYANDATAPSYFAGNVGIGTTSPTQKLQVEGNSAYVDSMVRNTSATGSANFFVQGNSGSSGAYLGMNGTGYTPTAPWDLAGAVYLQVISAPLNFVTSNAQPIGFYTNNAARVIIDATGNVGIGTTSPTYPLDIQATTGKANIQSTTAGNQAILKLNSQLNTTIIGTENSVAGTVFTGTISNASFLGSVSPQPLQLATNGTVRMTLDTAGNVGIGQTAPGYKLDVTGDINATGCLRSSVGVASGTCVSDERLKTEIQSFDLGLEALLGINPKYFKYNGLGGHPASEQLELGVIAQDVEKTAPALIKTKMVKLNPDDKELTEVKQVNYTAFSYVVINAVKELYHKIMGHDDRIQALEVNNAIKDRDIASVKADNEKLKQENAAMKAYLCAKDPKAAICE